VTENKSVKMNNSHSIAPASISLWD